MTCTPSTPAPPRKRRRPNQDLQERLARCEELLKEYAASSASKPGPHAFLSTPSTAPTCSPGSSQDEYFSRTQPRLVHENGNLRFMDQPLFTHLHDEVGKCDEKTTASLPQKAPDADLSSFNPCARFSTRKIETRRRHLRMFLTRMHIATWLLAICRT